MELRFEDHREARQQRAEARAHTVAVKLTIPLVLCLFPTIFIDILGPAFIQAFRVI